MLSQPEPPLAGAAPLAGLADAWDCHVHVFGPRERYPLVPERRYTPGEATVEHVRAHAARIGARRLVLVQASPYGHDNRCLLDALAALGTQCRGVIALKASALDDTFLVELATAGVRGVRLNPNGRIRAVGDISDELRALTTRLRGTRWHVEVNCPVELAEAIAGLASAHEVSIVFDHLMGLDPAAPDFSLRLDQAVDLMMSEAVWVKVSGTARAPISTRIRANQAEAIRRLHDCAPERLVWGSDWPHTPLLGGESGFRSVDDVQEVHVALSACGIWAEHLFCRNPERLFA